jgi:septal ring factor EnvC (AmiA/AmiB activator)
MRNCSLVLRIGFVFSLSFVSSLAGCGSDQEKLKEENERLREQMAKQESTITSLQEGNKFAQQEVEILTRELREAKKESQRLETERHRLNAKLDVQLAESKRLARDAQGTSGKTTALLQVDDKGGQSEEVAHALSNAAKATEDVLSQNGYAVRASLKADKRAVYITERKNLAPASLELSGFRNQYLVSLVTLSPTNTRIIVKAEFEKLGQGGRLLPASHDETAEIERRLLLELTKALGAPGRVS